MTEKRVLSGVTLGVVAVLAILLLIVMRASWRNIRPGYVGIVFDKANHHVAADRLEPGWAFINPLTQAIQEYPVTIQTYSMVHKPGEGYTGGDDSIKIQSNEGQQLNLDVVIQYEVVKEEAALLYQEWGGAGIGAVQDGIVRQYTRSQVPVVAAKYGWEEITSAKRGEVVSEVSTILTREFKMRHINLVSFGIREVHLPASLQAALDQKIQAQQGAEQQKYQLQQARVKAEQDVAEAQGRANALRAQAEGEAAATLTRAHAQSDANKQLAQALSSEFLQYQALQRWDGRLPLVTGSATPFINMSDVLSAKK